MTDPVPKVVTASLSARRAWIEIVKLFRQNYECFVALRKESVDRNARKIRFVTPDISSLSARRAWIEIDVEGRLDADLVGRSPQGERG